MKIDPSRIPAIWKAAADGLPLADIGAREGVTGQAISHIITGRSHTALSAKVPAGVRIMARQLVGKRRAAVKASPEHQEILDLLCDGLTLMEVADVVGLSYSGIQSKVERLYKRRGYGSISQMVVGILRGRIAELEEMLEEAGVQMPEPEPESEERPEASGRLLPAVKPSLLSVAWRQTKRPAADPH